MTRCCSLRPQRPAFCPLKHPAAPLRLQVQQRGVDVGVALILHTADDRVLLTRRAKELRVFPSVWVPPGLAPRPGTAGEGEGGLLLALTPAPLFQGATWTQRRR